MKKLISFIIFLALIFSLAGCREREYELAWDGFCYLRSGEAVELEPDEKGYIIDLLNEAEWDKPVSNCLADFFFATQRQHIDYHSECGVMCDTTNGRSTLLSDRERERVNSMLFDK